MPEESTESRLTRRNALTALATIGVGSAAVGAGTYAAFSDTEQSTPSFEAGTLNLKAGQDHALSFSASDIKPGDSGESYVSIAAAGSVDGDLSVTLGAIDGTEGETPSSETNTSTSDGSELPDQLQVKMWFDAGDADDGTFDSAEDYGLLPSTDGNGNGELAHDSNDTTSPGWNTLEAFPEGAPYNPTEELGDDLTFHVDWQLPDNDDDNELMGDTATVDFQFTLEQR